MSTTGVSDPERAEPEVVLGALATLAAYFARIVRDAVPGNAANDTSERYYDARTSPMGRRAFLRLAREKAFPTFKAGKRLVARRADVHAWIEAQEGARAPAPRKAPEVPRHMNALSPEELHAHMMARDEKPAKGSAARRQGPPTRRSGRR
ncbi:hypothetical protein [Polyangium aurulentum]|uniref:hypothetical protein n=1 Tax=Polyangium aurulentum TaxID=2567896 RepID=UPI0010AE5E41|nr:hypothetical protein [Polyangium aurulentum]UQA61783.1 hypothetical protein E8A73_015445 [Polyangium aurulentum]